MTRTKDIIIEKIHKTSPSIHIEQFNTKFKNRLESITKDALNKFIVHIGKEFAIKVIVSVLVIVVFTLFVKFILLPSIDRLKPEEKKETKKKVKGEWDWN